MGDSEKAEGCLEKAEALTPSSSDAAAPVDAITPDGDVILVVGRDEVRLRVDSHCLRPASKVFDAMFGPRWNEGQNLSSESPKEVVLQDDDADALRAICHVLHHKDAFPAGPPKPYEILQIAYLSDKYQLNVALKYAVACWLAQREENNEKGYLLAAAFLFEARDEIAKIARGVILNYDGSFLNIVRDGVVSDMLPLKMWRLLDERRTQARVSLLKLLTRGAEHTDKSNSKRVIDWVDQRDDEYKQMFGKDQGSWVLLAPLAQIIARLRSIPSPPGYSPRFLKAGSYPNIEVDIIRSDAKISFDCMGNHGDLFLSRTG